MKATMDGIEISHPVLTNGKPVIAAGEVEIAGSSGSYFGMDINPRSGHYHYGNTNADNDAIRAVAKQKFKEQYGIEFPD
jgi:hypothetical protein